ncbi:hypothetical protein [Diadegma fenestrale ichnovirus]|nr:hypothetical protein [Diadegma fenestrale ichnovirus]
MSCNSVRRTACFHGATVPAAAKSVVANCSLIRLLLAETRSGAILPLNIGMIKRTKNRSGCMPANALTCMH